MSENSAAARKIQGMASARKPFEGARRTVIVNTISYTGWKLVGVIPDSTFTHGMINVRYFIVMLMLLMVMTLVIIFRVVSVRISSPICRLK